MAAVGDARKRAVENGATTSRPYCLRCEVPIYRDGEGVWRRESTGSQVCPRNPAVDGHEPLPAAGASERAAGELVADIDTLAAAIRRVDRWYGSDPRALAEALVAAGFGRVDAARREIAEAERRGAEQVVAAVEAVATDYEIPGEFRGRANNLCRADAARDFRAAAHQAAQNTERAVERSGRVIHAQVTPTGGAHEPTGLVEVSIEALRMLAVAAGFELVEHPAPGAEIGTP